MAIFVAHVSVSHLVFAFGDIITCNMLLCLKIDVGRKRFFSKLRLANIKSIPANMLLCLEIDVVSRKRCFSKISTRRA